MLRAPPASLDEFRGLFSESSDPLQWPHVATGVTYQRAIPLLADHLGCDPSERAVYERRLSLEPDDYASRLLRAAGTEAGSTSTRCLSPSAPTGWRGHRCGRW